MTKLRVYTPVLAVFLILLSTTKTHAEISLNGVATHSELGEELFIAGLYTSTPSTDKGAILTAQEEKQIQVRVTTDKLSSRRFKRMWIEGMAVNSSANELKDQSGNMAAFSNMLNVRLIEGDIFTVSRYNEGSISGVKVIINGTQLGEISDPQFFDLLLRTWLGPVPLSSEFRNSLTRAGNIDPALKARYDATFPSDERVAEIDSAMTSQQNQTVAAAEPRVSSPPISAPTVSGPTPPTISAPSTTISRPTRDPAAEEQQVAAIAPPKLSDIAPKPGSSSSSTAPSATGTTQATPKPAAPTTVASAKPSQSVFEDPEEEETLTAEGIYKQQLYVTELKRYSNQFLKYPNSALNRGKEGSVRLNVIIDRDGNVIKMDLLEESDYSPFNRAAERAVSKASPFPPVPAEVKGETFTFTLPIVFVLAN